MNEARKGFQKGAVLFSCPSTVKCGSIAQCNMPWELPTNYSSPVLIKQLSDWKHCCLNEFTLQEEAGIPL